MKRIVLALLLLWPLFDLTPPAAAQSPELMAAYRQYEVLKARRQYAAAEAFVKKALELGKDEFGPEVSLHRPANHTPREPINCNSQT